MKIKINQDESINNFVRIFTMVCKQITANSNQILTEENIRKYIKSYLLSSCIEINDSVMSFDFKVDIN